MNGISREKIEQRHPKWDTVMQLLDAIAHRYGTTLTDKRNGRQWDVGQAVCAEAYGKNWMESEVFHADDSHPDCEPPAERFIDAAHRLAEGDKPEWLEGRG